MVRSNALLHAKRVISFADGQPDRLVEEVVSRSWRRSLEDFGLDPAGQRLPDVLEVAALRERQQALGEHLELAKQEMENLYQQIAGSGFAILLTDPVGTVLASVADPSMQRDFERAGLWLGSVWGEASEGTNGIGTCVSELRPINIHREEHFRSRHIRLSCSAAPILDPNGQLLAVLDASSANSLDTKASQAHTLALLRMSATVMENCYFLRAFADQWVVRFHSRPEFVGLLNEGMLAIDQGGCILAANGSALAQLERASRARLVGKALDEVLDVRLGDLPGGSGGGTDSIWPTRDLRRGRRFFAQLRSPIRNRSNTSEPVVRCVSDTPVGKQSGLMELAGNDPCMLDNVRRATRLIDHDIALVISGETGTGKEVFARALHQASSRSAGPFIPVNCAAIPENLIESELFGYGRGAFTGARKEGMRGKIAQSSGGTLFLDEIGDMPLALQTRLLRVLEDRVVAPLGSEQAIEVDIKVISATHRSIEDLVAEEGFREDLYYRLNGMTLCLPPLRARSDRSELIKRALSLESSASINPTIAPSALRALEAYHWPGNIRQLRNVLRTACALSEDGVIRLSDLPPQLTATAVPAATEHDEGISVSEQVGTLASAERDALIQALDSCRWNVTRTAQFLGVSRNTLYRKLRKHDIAARR